MYDKRIKIFVILTASLLLVCLLRLIQMQLLADSIQDKILELKLQRGLSKQLKTVRGTILDRKERTLALDQPKFQLHISYRLSSIADERLRRAKLLKAAKKQDASAAAFEAFRQTEARLTDLQRIIDKCTYFGFQKTDIENRIHRINERLWNLRTFLAWVRNDPNQDILRRYDFNINSIPLSQAAADFQQRFPDEDDRLLLIADVDDISELDAPQPLLELRTNDDIFAAQVEFLDTNDVQILPKAQRFYPYGSVAAQTIATAVRDSSGVIRSGVFPSHIQLAK